MAISMLKIRRPLGRLIFNMGIAIPGKTVFLIETAPRAQTVYNLGCTVSLQVLCNICMIPHAANKSLAYHSDATRTTWPLISTATQPFLQIFSQANTKKILNFRIIVWQWNPTVTLSSQHKGPSNAERFPIPWRLHVKLPCIACYL